MAQWIFKANARVVPRRSLRPLNVAEDMLTQVDSDGMSTTLMEAIVDHQSDEAKALQHQDKYVQTKNGRHHLSKSTKGWELLITWNYKSES